VRSLCRGRAAGLERELPRLSAKAKPREQRRWALVATRGAHVLLGRRRVELRFGGLWEPPSIDATPRDGDGDGDEENSTDEIVAALGEMLGVKLRQVAPAGHVSHVLSHRRLEIDVIRAELDGRAKLAAASTEYDTFELVDPATLSERGISTLARKILRAAIEPTR
jgi:A/G-specific adenine glycosylase